MFAGAFQTKAIQTCAIYLRVSSREQIDGYSLDAQERAARAYAEQRGWTVIEVYIDPGKSGKSAETRPGFRSLIADAEAHRFDAIIVHKLDRFSRSIVDILVYLERLRKADVSFASVTESFADFTTPMGWLMLVFLAMLAEWYLKNLAFEIQKGKRERVAQGDWNGRLSFGYTTPKRLRTRILQLGDDLRAGRIDEQKYSEQITRIEIALRKYQNTSENAAIPCPFDGPGVQFAFRQYATGLFSLREVVQMMTSAGWFMTSSGKRSYFTESVIRDMFSNRFYLGEVRINPPGSRGRASLKNKWKTGNHAALITHELFEETRRALQQRASLRASKSAPTTRLRTYPLTGVLRCLCCGSRWHGWTVGGRYRYRVERRMGTDGPVNCMEVKSAAAVALEEQVGELMRQIAIPPQVMRFIQEKIVANNEANEANSTRRERIEDTLDRLKVLFKRGELSQAEYERETDVLVRQLQALAPVTTSSEIVQLAATLSSVGDIWDMATLEEKQVLISQVFSGLFMRGGKIVAAQATPLSWMLLEAATMIRGAGRTGNDPQAGIRVFSADETVMSIRMCVA